MASGMVHKTTGLLLIDKETIIQPDENTTRFGDQDRSHHLAGAVANGDLLKLAEGFVEAVDTTGSPNPEIALHVVTQTKDIVIGQPVAVGQIGPEDRDPVPIVPAESIAGGKPHESLTVLKHFLNLAGGQALRGVQNPEGGLWETALTR